MPTAACPVESEWAGWICEKWTRSRSIHGHRFGIEGKLQKLGVIRYARGRITVLDRPRLEQLCCECYAVVKKETDRLLPQPLDPAALETGRGPGRHWWRCD